MVVASVPTPEEAYQVDDQKLSEIDKKHRGRQ